MNFRERRLFIKTYLKNLGIQSEMFCDSMVRMYETGRITNAKKGRDINKSTYSFSLGIQNTYDFLDNNPRCASSSVYSTNSPEDVARNDNVMSINNILRHRAAHPGSIPGDRIRPGKYEGAFCLGQSGVFN